MLRITRTGGSTAVETLKLEGKLLAPWVGEVEDASAVAGGPSRRLCLDLSALTFADAAGIRLLRALHRRGITIAVCPDLIRELLHEENP
jgi:hypothetical protein